MYSTPIVKYLDVTWLINDLHLQHLKKCKIHMSNNNYTVLRIYKNMLVSDILVKHIFKC